MEWLGNWLKEVIMVVLLATFVDMLLPSRSMERYVKLVLSLLVLVTLLNPLIQIVTDAPLDKLSAAISRMDRQPGEGGSKSSLDQIMNEAEQIKHRQQTQTLQWAGEQVASTMKEQIKQQTGEEPANVQVVLGLPQSKEDPNSGTAQPQPYISAVTVTLRHSPDDSSGSGGSQGKSGIQIEPVKPVHVQVTIEPDEKQAGTDQQNSASGGDQAKEVDGPVDDKSAGEVRKLLASEWNIDPGVITVQSGSGQQSRL
ncbi:stage III sporulation protein AF [Paenibacillus sp. XY044]|uniref:stage III sporulation protein AF n=1 Tax=Paenibacillus sp. XY044 TaxID=2026089 RepID=UPI000B99269E|nr:stage III sporulation protein AF [Paenibacillus sp. XY044]OZB94772.1 stage III sporulation protein AF [Paenibacillus sp. XY044]